MHIYVYAACKNSGAWLNGRRPSISISRPRPGQPVPRPWPRPRCLQKASWDELGWNGGLSRSISYVLNPRLIPRYSLCGLRNMQCAVSIAHDSPSDTQLFNCYNLEVCFTRILPGLSVLFFFSFLLSDLKTRLPNGTLLTTLSPTRVYSVNGINE